MNFEKLKLLTEPSLKELFTNGLSYEEQCLIQGYGAAVDEETKQIPIICLHLRVGDARNQSFIDKWDNKSVLGIKVKVDVRQIARG